MSIDLQRFEASETPAIAAKKYPLNFVTLFRTEASTPRDIKLCVQFRPFRRVINEEGVITEEIQPANECKTEQMDVENFAPLCETDEAGRVLIAQTIGAFVAAGGNIMALSYVATTLGIQAYAESIGALKGPGNPPPPVEPATEPVL